MEVKERPILFNGEMVRAILDGRKTQTRRLVKPQPEHVDRYAGDSWPCMWQDKPPGCDTLKRMVAPLGTIGDRLWVRETWGLMSYHDTTDWCGYSIKDVSEAELRERFLVEHAANWNLPNESAYWRPSIHMPRWASRITLEITGVRVERVQEMEGMDAASSDALKEGVHRIHHEGGNYYYSAFRNQPDPKNWTDPCLAFKELWQSIYANWDANPWVWVYEFRRIKP